MKELQAFDFNSVQNTKQIAILARRDGLDTVEALIDRLDRYIVQKTKELKLGIIQPEPGIQPANKAIKTTKEQKKNTQQARSHRTLVKRTLIEKLRSSTQCPECENGRVIEDYREGILHRSCTYPQTHGGGFIKFESGCGYSRMVK